MRSGGKHKSHAPLDLKKVGFWLSKAHSDAATDGRSNSKRPISILCDVLVKVE